jgi:hypothetical protein|tara:strand:- start:1276 stop:1569 length:294 start_codon:yes stop_codon:yes gene_type:complete
MAIVRKAVISSAEHNDELKATFIDVDLIDYNTTDPPGSYQVGESLLIEIEDDPNFEESFPSAEAFIRDLLQVAREIILKSIVQPELKDVAEMRMRRG